MSDIKQYKLFKWLKSKDSQLASRVLHIREELSKWLPNISQLFPHYPSHGLDHSDRIVEQLSRLLFTENKNTPVVRFSAAEAYCLICAAYLHDIGMVVSPGEANSILASDSWKVFVEEGGSGNGAYQKLSGLRTETRFENQDLKDFVVAQALRLILADFVRRHHHERGKVTLEMHPFLRGLVDDGDSVAFETIADIGVGHGLQGSELGDDTRFPEERDVFSGKVNVKFLTRLLRIGDLLDMSSKRADPMSARAVGPLAASAQPHWQQYSSKKHENITPKAIEFTFECRDQDTHRVLRDWFGWLEAEVQAAGLEQPHAARHDNWKAPKCFVHTQDSPGARNEENKATILIKPAAKAEYTFHNWRLELDHDLVLQRLVRDVYHHKTVFVRELLQNALDATRCKLYDDFGLKHLNVPTPERPTQFDPELRERYPISISLAYEDVALSSDGPIERRPVFTIEDRGIGMNEDIIVHYFLQIGRSYYQSHDFRERYKFAPTSRFGIGFLSVFAVSRDITVDTAKRDDTTGTVTGTRLRLREPRNYLLTEPWRPFENRLTGTKTGTRIRVVLDEWPNDGSLTKMLQEWCVAVEFPIWVNELGTETVLRPERLIDGAEIKTGRCDPSATFVLRAFDIDVPGIEGQIAVVAYVDAQGDAWCDYWPTNRDLGGKRIDRLPNYREGYTALHGLRFGGPPLSRNSWKTPQWILRCDVRSSAATVPLARSETTGRRYGHESDAMECTEKAVSIMVRKLVENHLATASRARGSTAYRYRGSVLSEAPVSGDWRDAFPGTMVTWENGQQIEISVAELLAEEELILSCTIDEYFDLYESSSQIIRRAKDVSSATPIVSLADVPDFCSDRFREKIVKMSLVEVKREEDLWLLYFKTVAKKNDFYRAHSNSDSWVGPANLDSYGAFTIEGLNHAGRDFCILSNQHEVVQWLAKLRNAVALNGTGIDPDHVESLWYAAADAPYRINELMIDWEKSIHVPVQLKPPKARPGMLMRFPWARLKSRSII